MIDAWLFDWVLWGHLFFLLLQSGCVVPGLFRIPTCLDECSSHFCLWRHLVHPLVSPAMAMIVMGIVSCAHTLSSGLSYTMLIWGLSLGSLSFLESSSSSSSVVDSSLLAYSS